LVLATESLSWVEFRDSQGGQALRFCRDDAQLARAGLPQYSSDASVFLSANGTRFIQAAGARHEAAVGTLDDLLPKNGPLVAISTTGRGMAVRRIAPLALGDFADLIAGTPLTLEPAQPEAVRLGMPGSDGSPSREILTNALGSLIRARAGRSDWLAEVLALKTRLFCQALRRVREAIAMAREPFLSLSEHAFAVRFGTAAPPFALWDFNVVLHAAGCAALRQAGDTSFAWRAMHEPQMPPAYERRSVGRQRRHEVECRLRLVTRQGSEMLVEATIGRCAESDVAGMLGCLHLPLAGGRRVLWGRLSRDNSLTREEIRFRSFPAKIEGTVTDELERMQGFVWSSALLDIVPAAGYGDDFHGLGVLAVRLLFTSERRQLPSSLDAMFSLIETLRAKSGAGSLPAQVREVFQREPRFRELLHPGRCVAFPISGEEAMARLGEDGWWQMIAFVVRLFPTDLATAFCRAEQVTDLGIFPQAFDEAIGVAEALDRRFTDLVLPVESINGRVRSITAAIRRGSAVSV
jgi:hypothetical protein